MTTPQPEPSVSETRLEIWTIVVLGLVALITAWAAFQSSLWNGVAIEEFARADAKRTGASTSLETGIGTYQEDRALFLEYFKAGRANDATLAAYIKRELMPKRLQAATDAWEKSPNRADTSPFRPAFGYEAPKAEAESILDNVKRATLAARNASSLGDQYNLAAVLFAASLFLAGISSTLRFPRFRVALLSIGTLIFIGTTLWMVTLEMRNPL